MFYVTICVINILSTKQKISDSLCNVAVDQTSMFALKLYTNVIKVKSHIMMKAVVQNHQPNILCAG
jgi:hypothetical protein